MYYQVKMNYYLYLPLEHTFVHNIYFLHAGYVIFLFKESL